MSKTRLLWHVPCPSDGTSLYRSIPYKRIDEVELVPINVNDKTTWETLYDIDVCFFQRPANQVEVRMIEACKRFNKPVIVDYDDFTLEISNPTNPAVEHYEKDAIKATIIESLKLADVVTVSTKALKSAFLEYVPEANIKVVPNAIDDKMFHVKPGYHERSKTILMRGAGSHKFDWELYSGGIKRILKEFPDYTLAVMGYHPEWLREIPANQIKYYNFSDIPTYFQTLMHLRPEVMIVPLVDDKFNRCKSNIAFYEGVVAGAVVLAPNLPEFDGAIRFESNDDLFDQFIAIAAIRDTPEYMEIHKDQINYVRNLSSVNEFRRDIIEQLKNSAKKYQPQLPKLQTATSTEFHHYNLSHGNTQDDPGYQQGHSNAAEWLIKNLRPKTAVEYGCGTGGTLVELLKRGVMAYGLEYNPLCVEYFKEHHPMYAAQIKQFDITKEVVEGDTVCDLGMSIEVFEHIKMPEEWWESFILDLSNKYRNFYFSSTPYHTTESFDYFWGHINIRRTTDWIKLFENSGWKFDRQPKILTGWDLLFTSKNV